MKLNKFFKSTAKIAGSALVSGASLLKIGAENLYDTVKDDRTKFKEIERINALCQELVAQFNSEKEAFDREFEQEHLEYVETIEKIRRQLEILDMLSTFAQNTHPSAYNFNVGSNVQSAAEGIRTSFQVSDVVAYKKGGAAGIAIGTGTVGLVTAFGSAGTGAALSSLTGSAYIHATLAALGGGTLASGGLGMLGGVAVLGAVVLAPALAVTGYITDKRLNKAYREALKREQEAAKFKLDSQAFLLHYKQGVRLFRHINRELYAFANFFEELVSISIATPVTSKATAYCDILNHAVRTILSYERLTLVNTDGSFNADLERELSAVKAEDNLCREEFYAYRTELSPAHQSLLNELKQQKIINDALQTEIQWAKDNRPQNYIVRNRTIRNEFNKALRQATEELDIISAWINFRVVNENMQLSFENLLKRGVVIKILYGIGDMNPWTCDLRNQRTIETAEHLKARFRHYPNFKMKCANTHEKLFICDEKFYVNSSLNILSFDARYDGTDMRNESGEASNNVTLIREYRKLLFDF